MDCGAAAPAAQNSLVLFQCTFLAARTGMLKPTTRTAGIEGFRAPVRAVEQPRRSIAGWQG